MVVIHKVIIVLLYHCCYFIDLGYSSTTSDYDDNEDSESSGGGDGGRNDNFIIPYINKKTLVIIIVITICFIIAIAINFINLHSDFEDLRDFYKGYQGRKLMIVEGRLTSRKYTHHIRQQQRNSECHDINNSDAMLVNGCSIIPINGGETSFSFNPSSTMMTTKISNNPPSDLLVNGNSRIVEETEGIIVDDIAMDSTSSPWSHSFPLFVHSYIEDHDPQWRDLDYLSDIAEPPESFFEFIQQYDFRFYQSMSDRELERRKNLYKQFRKWKVRKRKLWNIVVTERAKKEMADQDKNRGGGRRGGGGGGGGGR